jgi:hypothetical protein
MTAMEATAVTDTESPGDMTETGISKGEGTATGDQERTGVRMGQRVAAAVQIGTQVATGASKWLMPTLSASAQFIDYQQKKMIFT